MKQKEENKMRHEKRNRMEGRDSISKGKEVGGSQKAIEGRLDSKRDEEGVG